MRYRTWTQRLAVLLVASAGVYGATRLLSAQEPALPPASRRAADDQGPVSGRVERFLRNDPGDIDGMLLDNGRQIHFPPHFGRAISEAIATGDRVEVQGRTERLPRGEVVFEASRIEAHGRAIDIEPRRPAPPPPPRKGRGEREFEQPMNARGAVTEMNVNRHGDVDGFVLSDGTEVKFPPHQAEQLSGLVRRGDEVRVEGRRHETPHGDIHLHADRITAVASGRALDRDEPGLPPREARPAPDRRAPDDRDAPHAASNDEILRELRALRRLVEDKLD